MVYCKQFTTHLHSTNVSFLVCNLYQALSYDMFSHVHDLITSAMLVPKTILR